MIRICNIFDMKVDSEYTNYAIVRSMQPRAGITQLPVLAPTYSLFTHYMCLRDFHSWNKDAFEKEYVPVFIHDLAHNEEAIKTLNSLFLRSRSGEKIALACFCANEDMCHRSIIAGILQGVGCEVITENGDYRRFYKMYQFEREKVITEQEVSS